MKDYKTRGGAWCSPGKAQMKKHLGAMRLVLAAILGGAVALATGDAGTPADESDETTSVVVLGEGDLADRAEILRNMYRRITPQDMPLVQDVGTWPAAWEEFGANWDAAAVNREYGTWVVPVEVSQLSAVPKLLEFYMGKNTPARREFIVNNLLQEIDA